MPVLNTLDHFRLLSYERGGLTICTFAEHAEEEKNNPDFEEHIKVLKKEYEVDGLIYLTEANRIIYFFTTLNALDESDFLYSFFGRTHPELKTEKVRDLLGNTLLYQGHEAVEYLYRFSLNPSHLKFIPQLLEQLLERSQEYKVSSKGIELAVSRIVSKAKSFLTGSTVMPDNEKAFDHMIEEEIIALSRECRTIQLKTALENVPEEVRSVKAKAISNVFGKEFEALDDKTKDLALRMLDFMEAGCSDIPKEILEKLKKED